MKEFKKRKKMLKKSYHRCNMQQLLIGLNDLIAKKRKKKKKKNRIVRRTKSAAIKFEKFHGN